MDWNCWGRRCRRPQEATLQGEARSSRLERLDFVLRVRHGVLRLRQKITLATTWLESREATGRKSSSVPASFPQSLLLEALSPWRTSGGVSSLPQDGRPEHRASRFAPGLIPTSQSISHSGEWSSANGRSSLPTVTFALALRALAARQGGPRLLGAAAGACPP